jgi:HSP20 family protein
MRFVVRNQPSWPGLADWTREFDDVFADMNRMLQPGRSSLGSVNTSGGCDVYESESGFLMSIDLPGVNKEDINIEASDGTLVLTAERHLSNELKNLTAHLQEKAYGKVQRSFRLPEGVDSGKINAHLENGVLFLNLPKVEAAKPKKIEIGSGKTGFLKGLLGSKDNKEESIEVNAR